MSEADLAGLEAVLNEPQIESTHRCPIQKAVDSFEGSLQQAVIKALQERDEDSNTYVWSAPRLVKLLNSKAGLTLTASTMQRHRGGNCSCR